MFQFKNLQFFLDGHGEFQTATPACGKVSIDVLHPVEIHMLLIIYGSDQAMHYGEVILVIIPG